MSIWEQLFTSLMRIFVEFIVIIVIVSAMLFLYNVSTVNSYISQCNEIVARSGGLTQKAYQKCELYSRDYYHNYFHVSVDGNATYDDAKNNYNVFTDLKNQSSYNYLYDSTRYSADSSYTEVPFGKATHYYVYSRVPFLRSLPDIPKLYYGTHDRPSGNSEYGYGEFQRTNLDGSNNQKYKNAGNTGDNKSQEAAPIEEDVHSLIRAGSQN